MNYSNSQRAGVILNFTAVLIGAYDNGNENGNDDELKALEILKNDSSITAKKMAERMNISPRKVSRLIKELKDKEKIVRVGSDRKGYWKIQ